MGYDIFKFGALYQGGEVQNIPQAPTSTGDVPRYNGKESILIGPAKSNESITWVKPHGQNLLIADRVVLSAISWDDLNQNGFVNGVVVILGGQRFRCRLLQAGTISGGPNEWDHALDETCEKDYLWHWDEMSFWGVGETKQAKRCVVRGYYSARFCGTEETITRNENVGFRPVLEPLGPIVPSINSQFDGLAFRLSYIPGGDGYCPVLQPGLKEVFAGFPDGYRTKMYTLLKDGRPVRMDTGQRSKFKDLAQLTLTDRYYGDEYLIPWNISNGVAIANRTLVKLV